MTSAALGARAVRRIGYGAMQLGGVGGRPAPPRADAVRVLRRAVELGVDHVDTAEFYGGGVVNSIIREALRPYPSTLTLVTKVGARHDAHDGLVAAQRPDELRAQVEANLRSLGVDRLDVVNLRRLDLRPGLVATGDQLVDIEAQLAELVALRDAGKIGAIGLSAVGPEQLRRSAPAGIVCVQNSYNLLDRDNEALLESCARDGIAWVPFFPLGSAFPGRPRVTDDAVVREVAASIGATPGQIGLAWLLARDPHVLLIPGTASVAHLEENLAAQAIELDDDQYARLDRVHYGESSP